MLQVKEECTIMTPWLLPPTLPKINLAFKELHFPRVRATLLEKALPHKDRTNRPIKLPWFQHRFGNQCTMIVNPTPVGSRLILAGSLKASHWAHPPPWTSSTGPRASLIFWLKCPNEIQICCHLKSHLSLRHTRNATRRTITIISF